MPRAQLPTTLKGWLVALLAALAGLIAGFMVVGALGGRL